jgi:transposase
LPVAGERIVIASSGPLLLAVAARTEIAMLQGVLGKTTLKNEIFKEAVAYDTARKWIAHSPLLGRDGL